MREQRDSDALEFLSRHPLIITLARVARLFRLDPVTLLRDGGDPFVTLVRIAAAQVVERDEAEKERQARSRRK